MSEESQVITGIDNNISTAFSMWTCVCECKMEQTRSAFSLCCNKTQENFFTLHETSAWRAINTSLSELSGACGRVELLFFTSSQPINLSAVAAAVFVCVSLNCMCWPQKNNPSSMKGLRKGFFFTVAAVPLFTKNPFSWASVALKGCWPLRHRDFQLVSEPQSGPGTMQFVWT